MTYAELMAFWEERDSRFARRFRNGYFLLVTATEETLIIGNRRREALLLADDAERAKAWNAASAWQAPGPAR